MAMTERVESGSSTKVLSRVFVISGAILAVFALNLFVLQPLFNSAIGPRAAQGIYILIRVVGLVALAYLLAKRAGRNRFQTLSTVLLVGFLDQVVLKGIWIKRDMRVNPAEWVGFEPTTSAIFVTMSMGFLFFIPIILILAFVGMESTRFRRDWSVK